MSKVTKHEQAKARDARDNPPGDGDYMETLPDPNAHEGA